MSSALREADRALFRYGKRFEILDLLKWRKSVRVDFLKSWRKGEKKLPHVQYPKLTFDPQKKLLLEISKRVDTGHPLGRIIHETAGSFLTALRMLENVGTKRFTRYSVELYGSPNDQISTPQFTTERAASYFLSASERFRHVLESTEVDFCITPDHVVRSIEKIAKKVFPDQTIVVQKDPNLTAKASAGLKRIRVRSSTCFAQHDIDQLVNHELLVHTLTLLNGRKQRLKILGLNSPRTTQTQEGLAVFAEFITSAIDMHRLRRISARVAATGMGMQGADFIEVFEFFLEQGQDERESFNSTMRIFRGGNVRGGVVFTKDIVYLRGFIEVHRFFLRALKHDKFSYPEYLFSGRFQTQDIALLEPYFISRFVTEPDYLPAWVKNRSTLLAYLLSSSLMSRLGLTKSK